MGKADNCLTTKNNQPMTAERKKAIELVDKFSKAEDEKGYMSLNRYRHIQFALIAVEEILNLTVLNELGNYGSSCEKWWIGVKNELQSL